MLRPCNGSTPPPLSREHAQIILPLPFDYAQGRQRGGTKRRTAPDSAINLSSTFLIGDQRFLNMIPLTIFPCTTPSRR